MRREGEGWSKLEEAPCRFASARRGRGAGGEWEGVRGEKIFDFF